MLRMPYWLSLHYQKTKNFYRQYRTKAICVQHLKLAQKNGLIFVRKKKIIINLRICQSVQHKTEKQNGFFVTYREHYIHWNVWSSNETTLMLHRVPHQL